MRLLVVHSFTFSYSKCGLPAAIFAFYILLRYQVVEGKFGTIDINPTYFSLCVAQYSHSTSVTTYFVACRKPTCYCDGEYIKAKVTENVEGVDRKCPHKPCQLLISISLEHPLHPTSLLHHGGSPTSPVSRVYKVTIATLARLPLTLTTLTRSAGITWPILSGHASIMRFSR